MGILLVMRFDALKIFHNASYVDGEIAGSDLM